MKKCKKCKLEKVDAEYYRSKKSSKNLRSVCKRCCKEPRKEYEYKDNKVCASCKQEKAVSNFSKNKLSKTGKSSYCLLCEAERHSKFVIHSYGITLIEHLNMLKFQDFKCAICNCVGNRALGIDHCHTSGKVRGLLCNNCNTGLGMFKDSQDLLLIAAAYLEHNRSNNN